MNKCSNRAHPHCTLWIMPGETACASGHVQDAAPTSFELISSARAARAGVPRCHPAAPAAFRGDVAVPGDAAARLRADLAVPAGAAPPLRADLAGPAGGPAACQAGAQQQPYLHISGFDPRAAGGRQAIRIDLCGMAPGCAGQLAMHLHSALIPHGASRHPFIRSLRGDWRPLFIEFSSRDKEHGQYRIEAELHSRIDGRSVQTWVCTLVILVPRADATLTEIHQTFLSTHKNVRVMADDGAIARVKANAGGGRLDIDVTARNAAIAQLDIDARPGKIDLGFSTIAWDEDLIEIEVAPHELRHAHPSGAACLVNAAPAKLAQRQVRLFALDECVLGRFEQSAPDADVLLAHFGENGPDRNGLTRRLSGRHAVIRRGQGGIEIEDVSRYGLLLDGVWPGKHKPVPLRLGMRIELSASIKGIVVLGVTALLPNGVIMHRLDQGAHAECFYILAPECHPGFPVPAFACAPQACELPLLFHQLGGFWHLDPATGKETPLGPAAALDKLCGIARLVRFAADPYPEASIERNGAAAPVAA